MGLALPDPPWWTPDFPSLVTRRQPMPGIERLQTAYVRYQRGGEAQVTGRGWELASSRLHYELAARAEQRHFLPEGHLMFSEAAPQNVTLHIAEAPAEWALPVKQDRRLLPSFRCRVEVRYKDRVSAPVTVRAHAIVQQDMDNVAAWSPDARVSDSSGAADTSKKPVTELKGSVSVTHLFEASSQPSHHAPQPFRQLNGASGGGVGGGGLFVGSSSGPGVVSSPHHLRGGASGASAPPSGSPAPLHPFLLSLVSGGAGTGAMLPLSSAGEWVHGATARGPRSAPPATDAWHADERERRLHAAEAAANLCSSAPLPAPCTTPAGGLPLDDPMHADASADAMLVSPRGAAAAGAADPFSPQPCTVGARPPPVPVGQSHPWDQVPTIEQLLTRSSGAAGGGGGDGGGGCAPDAAASGGLAVESGLCSPSLQAASDPGPAFSSGAPHRNGGVAQGYDALAAGVAHALADSPRQSHTRSGDYRGTLAGRAGRQASLPPSLQWHSLSTAAGPPHDPRLQRAGHGSDGRAAPDGSSNGGAGGGGHHTLTQDFEFTNLELLRPTRMNKIYMVFACTLLDSDTLYVVYHVPTVGICRAEQREKACQKLGVPLSRLPDPTPAPPPPTPMPDWALQEAVGSMLDARSVLLPRIPLLLPLPLPAAPQQQPPLGRAHPSVEALLWDLHHAGGNDNGSGVGAPQGTSTFTTSQAGELPLGSLNGGANVSFAHTNGGLLPGAPGCGPSPQPSEACPPPLLLTQGPQREPHPAHHHPHYVRPLHQQQLPQQQQPRQQLQQQQQRHVEEQQRRQQHPSPPQAPLPPHKRPRSPDPQRPDAAALHTRPGMRQRLVDEFKATGLSRQLTERDLEALLSQAGFPSGCAEEACVISAEQLDEFLDAYRVVVDLVCQVGALWNQANPCVISGFDMDRQATVEALRQEPAGTFICRFSMSQLGSLVLSCKVLPGHPQADADGLLHAIIRIDDLQERRIDAWIRSFSGATHVLDVYRRRRVDKKKVFIPSSLSRVPEGEPSLQSSPVAVAAADDGRPSSVGAAGGAGGGGGDDDCSGGEGAVGLEVEPWMA